MVVQQGQSGAQSSHSETTGNQQGAAGGGEVENFRELFEKTQGELSQTREHTSRLEKQFSQVQKQNQEYGSKLDRLRAALTGEDDGADKPSPTKLRVQELEAEMDQYIQAAIQAEREGRPIPLTANAAIKSLKFQIEAIKEREEFQKEIKALKAQLKDVANPSRNIDQTAYSNLDNHLMSALTTIYGPEYDVMPHFRTLGEQISNEIKELKADEPEKWDRIRRDPAAQRKMVNYFVERSLPPKVRQMMAEDQIRKTPLTGDELLAAWREAKAEVAKDPQNPTHRRHMNEIRGQLMEALFTKNMPGARPRTADLY